MKRILLCGVFFAVVSALNAQRDSLQYAPGYPAYRVSQYDQLCSFPLPRFKPGNTLHRNFSWFDFMYMAYDYSQVTKGQTGSFVYPGMKQAAHAQAAIDMNVEMYSHWNYYYNIPTPTYNYQDFSRPNTFSGKITAYADRHPGMAVCTYIFWGAVRPSLTGDPSRTSYIKKFESIDPCAGDTTYPKIRIDGNAQRYCLQKLADALPHRDSLHKVDFVNENGEIFGPSWYPNGEGYNRDPRIACIQHDSATARVNRGHWQYTVFNAYKRRFTANDSFPAFRNSEFSFYQVSAFLPRYYGEYSEMRRINQYGRGGFYATPDFYPGDANHSIFDRYAAYHGLDCIAEGRKTEIALGDDYFSPFVCAGWFADSLNYRPAQWLAAMKALAMMGAEYYYPAFFNTSNPSVKMPVDPRGYMYQVVMPIYAQAVTSRFEPVFFGTKDFTYANEKGLLSIYRHQVGNGKNIYAIHASDFSGEKKYDAAHPATRKIVLDGERITVNFRPQGSTYIYDKSDSANVIFYQLDAWHENAHPWYWSKNFDFEAELHDDSNAVLLHTDRPAGAARGDYTDFTTYVYFTDRNCSVPLGYYFEPRNNDSSTYYVWVRARCATAGKKTSCSIFADGKKCGNVMDIQPGEFRWYVMGTTKDPAKVEAATGQQHLLQLKAGDSNLQVDRIILSTTKVPAEIPAK
ncbi:MAG TPA: hypothetical protein VFU15_11915 [Bacteroidia bacterium]|nr:hypothetical protein [Bacteroidia bacterium]